MNKRTLSKDKTTAMSAVCSY